MAPSPRPDKSEVIAEVCIVLSARGVADATEILHRSYKFAPEPMIKRKYGPLEAMRIFVRDGFVDRYTGTRVICPAVFRVLSIRMPQDFPYHPAWKTDLTHPAYWELGATVDHLKPVSRGGEDGESNWITASMASNSAKMNWSLEDLGWTLHPAGDYRVWDGLTGWFLKYCADNPDVLGVGNIRHWYRAARSAVPG